MTKTLCPLILAIATLLAGTRLALAGSVHTTISISARVERFAEWADPTPVILETDWSGPTNKVNQNRIISKPVVLYTNTDSVISAKAGLNNGVLTRGDQTLKTAYEITGAVAAPDAAFKNAGIGYGEFFSAQNTYAITHQPGVGAYTINLVVQSTSPEKSAPDEGLYTCGVILTAEW